MTDRYFDLQQRQPASAQGYLTQCLLASRLRMGLSSTGRGADDEDVNVYLAHLLLSLTEPEFLALCHRYVSPRDQDIFHAVQDAKDDAYLKYVVYRVNADHLLVGLGLFHNIGNASPHWFARARACHAGHGQTYYQFAATYHRQLSHKPTATGEILTKLSSGFDTYASLLTQTREAYFQFVERIAPGEVERWLAELQAVSQPPTVHSLRDQLLDGYSAWLKHPTQELRERLQALASELARRDPEFRRDAFPL